MRAQLRLSMQELLPQQQRRSSRPRCQLPIQQLLLLLLSLLHRLSRLHYCCQTMCVPAARLQLAARAPLLSAPLRRARQPQLRHRCFAHTAWESQQRLSVAGAVFLQLPRAVAELTSLSTKILLLLL